MGSSSAIALPVCAALLLAYGASILKPAPLFNLIKDCWTLPALFCLSDYLQQGISYNRSEALSLWDKRYPRESKELNTVIHLHLPHPGLSNLVMQYCFFKSDTLSPKRKNTDALPDTNNTSDPWP